MKKNTLLSSAFIMAMVGILLSSCSTRKAEKNFTDHFPEGIQRVWIGSNYWANRLQDWQINHGRLECITSQPNRNVNLLTWRLKKEPGTFNISFKMGLMADTLPANNKNWIGIRLGARGQFNDYRDDAIYGKGLNAGITSAGDLFIGEPYTKENGNAKALIPYLKTGLQLVYKLEVTNNKNHLVVSAVDSKTGKTLAQIDEKDVPSQSLYGSLVLVSNFIEMGRNNEVPSCWFDDWEMTGTKLRPFPDRAFGPLLFSQYTLSNGTMKLTVQLPPIGPADGKDVEFQMLKGKKWITRQKASIDPDARTATFKIGNWDSKINVAYRLIYQLNNGANQMKTFVRTGTIRKNPTAKEEIVVAAFTGNNDLGFPNKDVYESVKKIDPDLLFFSGDQIYEGVAGFGTQRFPLQMSILDYLRKWYLYGWEYGELFRDHPSISIPDDHDVYHGNVWGNGGKATPIGLTGNAAQDAGGYKMPPEWVNMVQRTQTSHLPDPYDPTPVLQDIGVYYTSMNYGGISFAILEDRKFKSAPKPLLPDAEINNGWPQNKNWDAAKKGDVPGAILLGNRQLRFLENWAQDWSHGVKIKTVLSQTIFENVATLPKSEYHDAIVPRLRILKEGEYPPDDRPVTDMDSDGWPQTGRNKAVKALRKAFALHIAGDQHLGSFTQYGVNDWQDASYAFCVPAISNIWPRRWFPKQPGENRKEGSFRYTGDFLDGFGNKMTVLAVSNPVFTGKKPSNLYDRATGYGIIKFHKDSRNIEVHCWPRFEDPTSPKAKEYPGWPFTINQMDNYNREAFGWLPEIKVTGMKDPVIKLYYEKTNELIYAVRMRGNSFNPRIFKPGIYKLVIGDEGNFNIYTGLEPIKKEGSKILSVQFQESREP